MNSKRSNPYKNQSTREIVNHSVKMRHILKCPNCLTYTMRETCLRCGAKTVSSKPPKYSPLDKYADYRRKAKREELIKKGLM